MFVVTNNRQGLDINYCLVFEIEQMSTFLAAIIKKLVHRVKETAGKNVSKSTG